MSMAETMFEKVIEDVGDYRKPPRISDHPMSTMVPRELIEVMDVMLEDAFSKGWMGACLENVKGNLIAFEQAQDATQARRESFFHSHGLH